ncbi:MAG: hypothetical protein HUU27_11190 [Phycisphaerae bacterium]|nr:hypothetical protein [Phycisphaerae bacterium]
MTALAGHADGPGGWTGGCGELGPDVVCNGHSIYNNATCVCSSQAGHVCLGQGWHASIYKPATVIPTELDPPPAVWSDPKPCGWRIKCRTNIHGYDGESCLSSPGCSFYGDPGDDNDKIFSYHHHPNLFLKGECIITGP